LNGHLDKFYDYLDKLMGIVVAALAVWANLAIHDRYRRRRDHRRQKRQEEEHDAYGRPNGHAHPSNGEKDEEHSGDGPSDTHPTPARRRVRGRHSSTE
jgi:ABC-type Zn2+ transport system substrate-binding protein/surface adhesin